MKKQIAIFLVPIMLFSIILISAVAGGASSGELLLPVASEEKSEEYATICSELGIPWQIVILTDAVTAFAENETNIEDKNPMDTALQFLVLKENQEEQVINDDNSESWNYKKSKTYKGKEKILEYISLSSANDLTADLLISKAHEIAEKKSTDNKKFIAIFHSNSDYEWVLKKFTNLKKEDIETVIQLDEADYMSRYLSEEALERIKKIQARFGMYQYNDDYDGTVEDFGNITFLNGVVDIVYYNQTDARWANISLGNSNIGRSGCGPTSLAIVIATLVDASITPIEVAEFQETNNYYINGTGTAFALFPAYAQILGLSVTAVSKAQPQTIVNALGANKLIIMSAKAGIFTSSGHLLVLRGVTEQGMILVADPNSVERSNTEYTLEEILANSSDNSETFWIFE